MQTSAVMMIKSFFICKSPHPSFVFCVGWETLFKMNHFMLRLDCCTYGSS